MSAAVITKKELLQRQNHVVARTERGKSIIQRNPRDLPRRLRVLLLSIDGTQTVQLYCQKLQGFGDVGDLLVELLALGLVQLLSPEQAKAKPSHTDPFAALEQLLDDSRFDSQSAPEVLYGSTTPGSFDDLLRVAQSEAPERRLPPAPAPQPVSPAMQQAQINSLFELLDAVRNERRHLKTRLQKMQRLRAELVRLQKANDRLGTIGFALGLWVLLLATVVAILLLRR